MSRKRCLTCHSVMDVHESAIDRDLGPSIPAGSIIGVYRCPHAKGGFDTHDPVPCQNCGDDVPGPDYHYYSIDGLLGSGKWTCTSTFEQEQASAFFNNHFSLPPSPMK